MCIAKFAFNKLAGRHDPVLAAVRLRGRYYRGQHFNREVEKSRFRRASTSWLPDDAQDRDTRCFAALEGQVAALVERAKAGQTDCGQLAAGLLRTERDVHGTHVHWYFVYQVLAVFARNGLEQEFIQLTACLEEDDMLRTPFKDSAYCTTQLTLYKTLSQPRECLEIMHRMKQRGVALAPVHYNCLIAACVKGGEEEVAFAAVKDMRVRGITMDHGTMLHLLACCQSLGRACRVMLMMESLGIHARDIGAYTSFAEVAYKTRKFERCLQILQAAPLDGVPLDVGAYSLLMRCYFRLGEHHLCINTFRSLVLGPRADAFFPLRSAAVYAALAMSCRGLAATHPGNPIFHEVAVAAVALARHDKADVSPAQSVLNAWSKYGPGK
ncbi:hypothetical protein DIPPA_31875 [Diplonema papillatum]|nr:hypothetical protein DIPPA_31875 [Diplonema papillatum]|eukprot:gene12329-19062_t